MRITSGGESQFYGNILIQKVTPGLVLNGTPFGNSGAYINFQGWAASNKNWQIGVANVGGSGLNFTPSTTAGGTSFTTPIFNISDSGTINATANSTTSFSATIASTNSSTPYVIRAYSSTDTNNSTGQFLMCDAAASVQRMSVRMNGGIYNYSANNSNLSDARLKKDIVPLESYWNKFKAIEMVKFKYIDQTHDDYNIGVIAQQVEAVAPEFIDTDWDSENIPEDGIPIKSVYESDLHHATIKVLQEAMAKIEELEAKVAILEAK
jgi:hypothetical protein